MCETSYTNEIHRRTDTQRERQSDSETEIGREKDRQTHSKMKRERERENHETRRYYNLYDWHNVHVYQFT